MDLNSVRFELVTDLNRIAEIQPQWSQLHKRANGGPFSSYDWICSWNLRFKEKGARPLFALAWNDETLIAAAPFGCAKQRFSKFSLKIPTLKMLCDTRAGFHDLLMDPEVPESVMKGLFSTLLEDSGWRAIDLTPTRTSAALEAFVVAAETSGFLARRRPEIETVISDLSDGWDAYFARRSSNFRKSVRRDQKKFDLAGGVIQPLDGPEPVPSDYLARLFSVASSSWKARMGTDAGANDFSEFLLSLCDTMVPKKNLRFLLLSVGDDDIASVMIMRSGNSEYGFIKEFNEAYADFSPGRVAVAATLETAAERGIKHFDMLRATPFTTRFGDQNADLERIRICRKNGFQHLLMVAEEKISPLGKEFRRRWRKKRRKRVAFKDKSGV